MLAGKRLRSAAFVTKGGLSPMSFEPVLRPEYDPFTLPAHKYGMTNVRFNLDDLPDRITPPHADVLKAANELNTYRFKELTDRQRVWASAYIVNADPVQATLDAGYTVDRDEAREIGLKLVNNKRMQNVIRLMRKYFEEKSAYQFDENKAWQEIQDIADANLADFIGQDEWGETIIALPEDDRRKMKTIKKLQIKKTKEGRGKDAVFTTTITIELHDQTAAQDKLLKTFGKRGRISQDTDEQREEIERLKIAASAAHPIMFRIEGIPSGEFLPAPENPYALTVEHQNEAVG